MNVRRVDKFSIMLSVLVFYSGHCWAASWQHAASARLSTEFDTNPLMSPTYTGGVWRELFEPSYSLTGITDKDELKTGFAVQIARSSNETLSPRRESPSVFVDWLRQINAGEFGISSRYAEIATRDAGIDSTGRVQVNSTRTTRSLSGKLSQEVSDRSTLSADVLSENVSYMGGTYIDYASRSANMLLNYTWIERSTPFLKTSYADYIPTDGGPISRFASAIFGLSWKVTDSLEATMHAGKYKLTGFATLRTLGGAALKYTGELTQLSLNAGRQVLPSGLGGFVIVDQASGNWSYALSERSITGIDLVWRMTYLNPQIINRTAGAWLQQELSSIWTIRTYYSHNTFDGGVTDGASSNIIGITFVYTHTDF